MGTALGDALQNAINNKKNDTRNFIWKGPKKAGTGEQEEIKLVNATPEQLRDFYKHCVSMLENKDKANPGRFILKKIIKEQIHKCSAELFVRWLDNKYLPSEERKPYPRYLVFQDVKAFLDANIEAIPKDTWDTTTVEAVMNNVPREFRDVTINDVLSACLDTLGVFDRRHLSLNFITKLGVWFTPAEIKDLTVIDEKTGKHKDKIEVIKERLRLKASTKLRVNNKGLSYTELRAMVNLKSKRYSELTTDQLVTLRNKVLFRFEEEVDYHISQWKERMRQIELVAQEKNVKLDDIVGSI